VFVDKVRDIEDPVELSNFVGTERAGKTHIADLVFADVLFSFFGDGKRLFFSSIFSPG
jgi:hypothetical protein